MNRLIAVEQYVAQNQKRWVTNQSEKERILNIIYALPLLIWKANSLE
ncbi:hypothetical protein JFL43_15840 [Viridibacillus sp. YIM B01967]|uniref:Transposase n=1 Tax=Viridibacillus soli TaxID=2798301 RepID=A0ABS1HA63_9BACL|nr:hypothetical protein [Viridibacillus soli]MBK3496306.1 hypothetical protein [Viridibacillus soli]